MTEDYSDIIGLPHHRSVNHRPLPPESRAAQFAPFAALTGYEAAVDKEARLQEAHYNQEYEPDNQEYGPEDMDAGSFGPWPEDEPTA